MRESFTQVLPIMERLTRIADITPVWPIFDRYKTNIGTQFRQAKTEIVTASKVAYRFLQGIATNSNSQVSTDSPSPNKTSPRFQVSWFKNLIPAGDKPSSSSVLEGPNQEVIRQQHRQQEVDNDATPFRQNGHHS